MSQRKNRVQQKTLPARRKRRRLMVWVSALLMVAAIAATVTLSGPPAYSELDVIGKQPAMVQVYLPT